MWKPIPKYKGLYEVSDFGEVRAFKRSGSKGMSLAIHPSKGYLQVWLSKDNKVKKFSVHRLVAMTFIENPKRKPQVNHKDGDKTNNKVSNLEWVTRAEQEAHKRNVLGKDDKGERNGNFGYRHSKMYPGETLRNKLCELGIPRYRHNLAELGEMLPDKIQWESGRETKGNNSFYCRIGFPHHSPHSTHVEYASTEADARAKMLIYLIENSLIPLPINR